MNGPTRNRPDFHTVLKDSSETRVLMLIENSTYPIDPRVSKEAMTLAAEGYQVSVICPKAPNQYWREDLNGVFIFRFPALRGQGFLGYVTEYLYSLVATFLISLLVWATRGFDIIHAANPPDSAVFIALFYKLFGKKFIFDHHDLAPEMYLVRSNNKGNQFVYRVLVWMEKISCRFADHVIATNQSHKEIEIQRGKVPESRITIVRNGPALDCLKLGQPDLHQGKRAVTIIGYIGVIGPQDGLDYLLRALNQLVTTLRRNDFRCIIIGMGSALADLKIQAQQLGLDSYVEFTGFIPHAEALKRLSSVDICVDPDPSNIYNDRCTMIKMMEYMALGKPIVAFNLPEHRVSAGEAAMYAEPNNELDFARKILTLMDDTELCLLLGQIGRDQIKNELAWPYQAMHLLGAYTTIRAAL